jgi:hypothetical protein
MTQAEMQPYVESGRFRGRADCLSVRSSCEDLNLMRLPALVVIMIGLALAGCARTMPVYNVSAAPVVTSSGKHLSANQVHGAIIGALNDKVIFGAGWVVRQDDPGEIVAEVLVRTHRAEVEIDYSSTQYSILYKDSENLLYDGSSIHRNYNKWVQLLEKKIEQHLYAL